MRHARHDQAIQAIEAAAIRVKRGLKYVIIVYDGPAELVREASFVSNVPSSDVVAVCHSMAEQLRKRAN